MINRNRNRTNLLAAYVTLFAFANSDSFNEENKENKENKQILSQGKHEKRQQKIKRFKKKGLKEFWYGSTIIYALNKKNADRKARKQDLI